MFPHQQRAQPHVCRARTRWRAQHFLGIVVQLSFIWSTRAIHVVGDAGVCVAVLARGGGVSCQQYCASNRNNVIGRLVGNAQSALCVRASTNTSGEQLDCGSVPILGEDVQCLCLVSCRGAWASGIGDDWNAPNPDYNCTKLLQSTVVHPANSPEPIRYVCPSCSRGTYFDALQGRCQPCPAGSFGSGGSNTVCELCSNNTYSSQMAGECTPCPPGFISAAGSAHCYESCSEQAFGPVVQGDSWSARIPLWVSSALVYTMLVAVLHNRGGDDVKDILKVTLIPWLSLIDLVDMLAFQLYPSQIFWHCLLGLWLAIWAFCALGLINEVIKPGESLFRVRTPPIVWLVAEGPHGHLRRVKKIMECLWLVVECVVLWVMAILLVQTEFIVLKPVFAWYSSLVCGEEREYPERHRFLRHWMEIEFCRCLLNTIAIGGAKAFLMWFCHEAPLRYTFITIFFWVALGLHNLYKVFDATYEAGVRAAEAAQENAPLNGGRGGGGGGGGTYQGGTYAALPVNSATASIYPQA